MSLIVKKVAQLITGFVFLYGIYIIVHGHLTPGGGFAGGAILAGAYILQILAFGRDPLHLKKKETGSSVSESVAIFLVLMMAVAGFFIGAKVFFNNYLPTGKIGELISAGAIPIYNILIGIEVAAALLTIFLALIIYKEEIEE
jgi:multicomponent Na+:H+ antiporter subunit B